MSKIATRSTLHLFFYCLDTNTSCTFWKEMLWISAGEEHKSSSRWHSYEDQRSCAALMRICFSVNLCSHHLRTYSLLSPIEVSWHRVVKWYRKSGYRIRGIKLNARCAVHWPGELQICSLIAISASSIFLSISMHSKRFLNRNPVFRMSSIRWISLFSLRLSNEPPSLLSQTARLVRGGNEVITS